ncbi:glutathione peroxidase [Demequina sp. SYSU T00039]|uniref:Glutathione peroxidase n=1 Tax=Demequina lignilytica TaxID=3051663 RepID=A0AAW7M4J9_9MICO|nr:glutathione peroxidase [Demequina sp. SYSU T00039]MDN4486631.1 glutathione peroxidase [Demequina sp. SYSU T00039]
MTTIADFSAATLRGEEQPLSAYEGQVVLVVNTASRCGLTPQFEGLEALHRELGPLGLAILGFPCNQFAGQEPLDADGIGEFCQANYGVTFPMFAKIDVNGPAQHPLYGWLKSSTRSLMGDAIKWNFTKFLVGRDGRVIRRYAPTTEPSALEADIRAALAV